LRVTDTDLPTALAAFRGPVTCRRGLSALTLTGCAADSADDRLIVTFIAATVADFPDSLSAATIRARDERRYRILSGSQEWIVEAMSVHVHRDIGREFYRAIPPRPVPRKKRFFWRVVLALAATRAGKRLLLSLRRQA
jgi:hypothetical protein